MTVHVLIPVFNRLPMTHRVLGCLRAQRVNEQLRIIIIDDGSTDGTGEFLAAQQDVTVLRGDGSLWWAGAIELGLQNVLRYSEESDGVLLVNNDTVFAPNFVQRLLDAAHSNAPAAVGSVICDETAPEQLLSVGAVLDTWDLRVRDKLDKLRLRDEQNGLHDVDALSGRGTLYPLAAFRAVGTMKPKWLPHYLADYELSVRMRRAGYRLIVTESAAVFSCNEFGSAFRARSLWRRYFSARSPSYFPAVFLFWWEASTLLQRFTLLPRLGFRSARKGYCRNELQ